MDVDSALPLDQQQWRGQGNNSTGRRAASVKVERIGEEIVNSISIHRIQDEEAHLDDIVAVLTNNDKTVRIYSLPANLETTVLDLKYAMNHATISPDGQTLVAVGDINLAYFFQREIQQTPPQIHKPHNRLTSASIEWTLTSVVKLHVSEPAQSFCYFTTAWSPSGQLVAVGSEGGYITVFDIDRLSSPDLEDDDGIVAIVPSSRPDFMNPHPGAIRSMLFSPEPWDLLIWAEDQGRICIGDLRTGLKSRQVVSLEPKEEGLNRITYEDVPGDGDALISGAPSTPRDIDELESEFLRRYRQAPDNATAVNFATEYIEARRRQRQMATLRSQMGGSRDLREREERSSLLEDDPRGLTPREQQILESLRTSRLREEARGSGIPRSVNYTTAEMFRDASASNRSTTSTAGTNTGLSDAASASSSARPISEILSAVPDSFPELSRTNAVSPRPTSSHGPDSQRDTLPPLSILQAGGSDWSTSGLVRLADGSRLPRRRQSVILTPSATNSPSSSSANVANQGNPGNNGNSGSGSSTSTYRPSTATAAAAAVEEEDNPWRTIEEHMTLARGPLFDAARARTAEAADRRPTEAELQAELAAERARARSLARQRERWRRLPTTSAAAGDNGTSPGGTTTAAAVEAARSAAAFSQGNEILLRRAQMRGGYSGREIGVRTAGLAMSPDGRMLWAACEEGIFEIEIRRKGRMFWGCVDPR